MHKPRVIFRADGNSEIGLGHIMRCVALAQMLNKDFNCILIIAKPSEVLQAIVSSFSEMVSLDSVNKESELLELDHIITSEDIVVLDGYLFDEAYRSYLKQKSYKLIIIDDFANGYFDADIVINHGSELVVDNYKTEKYTKVLGGFKYLILRNEFLKAALATRNVTKVDTAFICMGGADPNNLSIKMLMACVSASFIKRIVVVTGSAYIHMQDLLNAIDKYGTEVQIEHHARVDAKMLIRLISNAQISICPSSTIALEVCCVKSGLLTGTTVDNQQEIHRQLLKESCGVSVGDFNLATIEDIVAKLQYLSETATVNQIMENQYAVIDGSSSKRIINEFKLLNAC